MDLTEIIKIAFQALRTNKVRAALTMLGIVIGVTSVIILVAIGSGLQSFITKQLEDLGSNLILVLPGEIDIQNIGLGGGQAAGALAEAGFLNPKLEFGDAKKIARQIKGVEEVVSTIIAGEVAKFGREEKIVQIFGTTANYSRIRNSPLKEGSFFDESDVDSARKVAVLGATTAENLFGDKSPIGKRIAIGEVRYEIIGVLESRGAFGQGQVDDKILLPITCVQQQFDQDNVNIISVQMENNTLVKEAIPQIEELMGQRLEEDEFSVLDQKDILSTASSILTVLTAALGGIAAISLLVGGVGIMNIMLVSVTERTREIGLRKAVGATPKTIMTQFLVEAVVLSIGGGIIGIGLGLAGSIIINHFFPTTVTVWAVLLAFLVSAAIGIIFGVAPAAKASRLNPIEALRYE